jgi:hypothetical protein
LDAGVEAPFRETIGRPPNPILRIVIVAERAVNIEESA